ncbi:unnamed protein product, partial [Closterium sp. NIES-54]
MLPPCPSGSTCHSHSPSLPLSPSTPSVHSSPPPSLTFSLPPVPAAHAAASVMLPGSGGMAAGAAAVAVVEEVGAEAGLLRGAV